MLQVTPTGPWGKDVHPNLPVSTDELLTDLRRGFHAGATGVHLHVRDRSGAETLEPAVVNATCVAVRRIAEDAFRREHDTRVGFEDSVLLPDGTTAESNAQLVEAALALR